MKNLLFGMYATSTIQGQAVSFKGITGSLEQLNYQGENDHAGTSDMRQKEFGSNQWLRSALRRHVPVCEADHPSCRRDYFVSIHFRMPGQE
jgi:hypothetical protein